MTTDTHAYDGKLAARLLELHNLKGIEWTRMASKTGLNPGTIANFAKGKSGLEPASYKRLLAVYAPDLPGNGSPIPQAKYKVNYVTGSVGITEPQEAKPPRIHLSVECINFWHDEQGRLVIFDPRIVSAEIVGVE